MDQSVISQSEHVFSSLEAQTVFINSGGSNSMNPPCKNNGGFNGLNSSGN